MRSRSKKSNNANIMGNGGIAGSGIFGMLGTTIHIGGLIFIIISIIFIFIYVNILELYPYPEETDILNYNILTLHICGWNLLHILFNYMVCYIFNISTIISYFTVFLLGILWFFIEQILFFKFNKKSKLMKPQSLNYVYSSIGYPRVDDILYNSIGIFLHFISHHSSVKYLKRIIVSTL